MFSTLYQATGFKRALDLFEAGRFDEGRALLKSLQDEFLAVCDENQALKQQLAEVAEVLDLAEKVQFDGQKYWLEEDGERKGPFCQVCYDRDGLLVHLHQREKHWECQSCQSLYLRARETDAAQQKKPRMRTTLEKTVPLFLEQELG